MATDTTVSSAKTDGLGFGTAAVAEQRALTEESLKLNIAMGWLQLGLSIAGKIAGR